MTTHATPSIVPGAMSTIADVGKDGAWLQGWLKEEPSRLGIGALEIADGDPVQDDGGNPAFLATDEDRYFSVDVLLGEMDASHGFQVLDNWARNRVRHPDKTHVAVLVTESTGDRYRTTLETLAEHLPLVVVELSVWRGKTEAIIAPRVALASDDIELPQVSATAAAADDDADDEDAADSVSDATGEDGSPTEAEAGDADETEAADPWRLPKSDQDTEATSEADSLAGVGSH